MNGSPTAATKAHSAYIGDKVIVTDGSSDGHTGVVVAIKSKTCIRIKRDADGVEVDVSNFYRLDG